VALSAVQIGAIVMTVDRRDFARLRRHLSFTMTVIG
jgi:hypothetical protein